MKRTMPLKFFRLSICLFLSACSSIPTPAERRAFADQLAAKRGWQAALLKAGQFELVAYTAPVPTESDALTIYIEGDGFAWLSGSQPSFDPSPRNPLALQLAIAQPEGNVAYLARPCQYIDAETSTSCPNKYWTAMRFSPEVIISEDSAVEQLKQRHGAKRLTLVGYSGGAAVALLIASRRNDVEQLLTVAGNLDHQAWTTYHHVSPLTGSLNPADQIETLQYIPQKHFAGSLDTTMPPLLTHQFINRFPTNRRPEIHVETEFTHACCWVDRWAELWKKQMEWQFHQTVVNRPINAAIQ